MRTLFAFFLVTLFSLNAFAAPTVTLTASPLSGISPVTVTLTWTSSGASVCKASGGWSGDKAVSGTETFASVLVSTTYTLTCSAADGSATIKWTAPTQNTDNSTIPATGSGSLAGFKLFHAPTSDAVATSTPVVINDKTATAFTLTGLPAGPRYYGMTAFNLEGISSDMTGLVTNVVETPATSASSSVTISTKPKPPTLVTVATVVYDLRWNQGRGTVLSSAIGTIPLGTPCGENLITVQGQRRFYEVSLDQVDLRTLPNSAVIVAQCEVQS